MNVARAISAGALYFALLFVLGFLLGTIRVLLIAPRFGEAAAVLLELPVMLAASWLVCRALIMRMALPPLLPLGIVMGATAFLMLITAEWALSLTLFERTLSETAAHYRTLPGAVGLAGQVAFAFFPLLHMLKRR